MHEADGFVVVQGAQDAVEEGEEAAAFDVDVEGEGVAEGDVVGSDEAPVAAIGEEGFEAGEVLADFAMAVAHAGADFVLAEHGEGLHAREQKDLDGLAVARQPQTDFGHAFDGVGAVAFGDEGAGGVEKGAQARVIVFEVVGDVAGLAGIDDAADDLNAPLGRAGFEEPPIEEVGAGLAQVAQERVGGAVEDEREAAVVREAVERTEDGADVRGRQEHVSRGASGMPLIARGIRGGGRGFVVNVRQFC